MIAGLSGSLLSHDAFEQIIRDQLRAQLDSAGATRVRNRMRQWHVQLRGTLGPTAGARTVFDRIANPLFAQLGYRVLPSGGGADLFGATLEADGRRRAALVVTAWGRDPASAWRDAVRQGIGLDVPWCFCATGPVIRVMDCRRTYSRRFIEITLDAAFDSPQGFELVWGLLRAGAMAPGRDAEPLLDRAIDLSENHRAGVREALQHGVEHAVVQLTSALDRAARRVRRPAGDSRQRTFDEAQTIVYRILFLLFAEARGLVPRWHPLFRDAYTIESLRDPVEQLPRPRGLWDALQAIARLAHHGCRIGALHVPPFNGRLFSPGHAPLSDTTRLDDEVVRRAVLALTTRPVRVGRVRVAYGDLGVEQLGGVYERLLDFQPGRSPDANGGSRVRRLVPAETRKATGSFYTPRSLTEFLVRRTLAPLVRDASPEQILALRIVDPAMGSGAFLVAACRYLAVAYELALVGEKGLVSADITEADRVGFRRSIAQQCLFGVDLNPTAVQLGRLSLWLATLSADKPLTFLDHRLRVGDSLIGARFDDLQRRPSRARAQMDAPTLFDEERLERAVGPAVRLRRDIASQPDDTLDQVRAKERALADLESGSDLASWKAIADLWCAAWFGNGPAAPVSATTFGALADVLLGRRGPLPAHTAHPLLEGAREIAASRHFFHWTLEFPEIFHRIHQSSARSCGFDAVIGNPPWEMLRGDRGSTPGRREAHAAAARLTSFARSSRIYRFQGSGHANLYQLFLERALSLVRDGGRLGIILPSGFAIDHGSSDLRRALFDRSAIDTLVWIENRKRVFPIHRSLKFLLVTSTGGGPTRKIACRCGIDSPAELDSLSDAGHDDAAVTLTRELIEHMSGRSLAIPELKTPADVEIVTSVVHRWPALGDPAGWHVRFGRELNATDDRQHFAAGSNNPDDLVVLEGKHLLPFTVDAGRAPHRIAESTAARLLKDSTAFNRPRLAYRDVASSTNRLSLIAAIVPARAVTTHTLFCLKEALDDEEQHFLCGIFNSFVANYLIRPRINTHVGASIIARLPVPRPPKSSAIFRGIATLSASLSGSRHSGNLGNLQALAAHAYGLDADQFRHILQTFPLVSAAERRAALDAFCDIVT